MSAVASGNTAKLLKSDFEVDLSRAPMPFVSLDTASVLMQLGKTLGPRELYFVAYLRAKTYALHGKTCAKWLRVPAAVLQRELGLSTYPQLHKLLMGLRDIGLLLIQEPDESGLRGYLLNPDFEKAAIKKQAPDVPCAHYRLDANGLVEYVELSDKYGKQRRYKAPRPRYPTKENGTVPSALSEFVCKCKRKFKES